MKIRVSLIVFFIALVGVSLNATERLLWSNAALEHSTQDSSYQLVIPAAGLLSIEAVSLSFSPRLLLVGPDGRSYQGEYSPRTATISAYVLEPGQYTISVSAPLEFPVSGERADGHGHYLLMADIVTPAAELRAGQPQNQILTTDAPLFRSETFVNWYSYVFPESGRAFLQLQSRDFDTVLVVYYPDGTQDYNDDYGDSTDSALRVHGLPGTQILIGVTSFSSGSTGAYTLTAEALAIPPGIGVYQPDMLLEKPGEYRFELNQNEHKFQLRLRAGERLEVLMESDDFDSYLELHGEDGSYWSDDDSGGDLNALLTMTAPVEGVYDLTARSFGFGEARGIYTLTLAEPPLLQSIFRATGVYIGEPVSFGIPLREGSTFTIEVGSSVFDTVLTLYGPDGTYIAEDDDGGEGTDSRLRFSPSYSGTYNLEIRGFFVQDHGEFSVQVYEHMK